MRPVHPRPQSLTPRSATHRRWFWVLMGGAIIVVAVGWMITIRGIMRDVPALQATVEARVDQAVQQIEDAQIQPSEQIQQAQSAMDALKAGYDLEKTRQEEAANNQ